MSEPELLGSTPVYDGRVFTVTRTRFGYPDGVEVEQSIVRHHGAVGIVALDEQGRWLLVRQYRLAAERELLEIPAGGLEVGEEPLATAPLPQDADERVSAPIPMTEAEVLTAIDDGRICDAKTVVAVVLLARYRERNGARG